MEQWQNVARAATGDTPARAALTDGDKGIHHRSQTRRGPGAETQSGRESTHAGSVATRAATVRLDRTGVGLSGTGENIHHGGHGGH